MVERKGRLALAWGLAATLAGCGGKATQPVSAGSAVIGSAGGSITEASGATVTIPPGAIAADTTYRIARDSTGAPALPTGLDVAGSYYVVTPHGGEFSEPVRVRLPAPPVALAPNQELMLAKAQPGGPWVLQETVTDEGFLVSQVRSFSYFVPVIINHPLALQQAPAFAVTTSVACNGAPCTTSLVGTQQLVFTVTGNDGQLPLACDQGLYVRVQGGYPAAISNERTLLGQSPVSFQVTMYQPPDGSLVQRWDTMLICGNDVWQQILGTTTLAWATSNLANVRYTTVATCNGLPCPPDLEGPQNIAIHFAGNGGALPASCTRGIGSFETLVSSTATDWISDRTSWTSGLQEFGVDLQVAPHLDSTQSPWLTSQNATQWHNIPGRTLYFRGSVVCDGNRVLYAPGVTLNWLIASPDAPVFVTQPRSVLVVVGETASLSAALFAVGPTAALQWQRRSAGGAAWADVTAGAGGAALQYTTPTLTWADSGTEFRVRARNANGTAYSQPATVSMSDVPVSPFITTQPTDLAVVAGSEAVFAVVVQGTEAMSYQWYRDTIAIKGANAPILKLQVTAHDDQRSFTVVVSNAAGSAVSDPAILSVSAGGSSPQPPTILAQPITVAVTEGSTAAFAVGVSGDGPLAFQWLKDDLAIPGANAAALSLRQVVIADGGAYSVVVSNGAGSVTSLYASLEVGSSTPVVTPPFITTQPATLVVVPGAAATLAVAASGTGPLAYQWWHDGVPVAGATGPVLTLASVVAADAGTYAVTVTGAGMVTSEPAQLSLVGAPLITAQPAAASAAEGSTAAFTVAATGDALRYQWERNGVPITGATAAAYTTPVLTAGDNGATFAVLLYNAAGLVYSQPAVLTVTPAPVVTAPLSTGKLAAGPTHTCAIKADGTVACWGHNSSREVTPLYGADQDLPVVVPGLSGMVQVAVGFQRSCAIDGAGAVSCWGGGSLSVQPLRDGGGVAITGAKAVTLGAAHGCFIDAGANVNCWGDNSVGQLGQGATSAYVAAPVVVTRAGGALLTGAISLSAGAFHTCALTSKGEVVCWGRGAIGDGSPVQPTGDQLALVAGGPAVTGASAMASGESHACAVLADGGMKCWGANGSAQLGNRNTTAQMAPVSVVDLPGLLVGVTIIAARTDNTCVIPASGRVVCWGAVAPNSLNGSLTYGPVVTSTLALPVVGLASGGAHSCALEADGSLECWGSNQYGQLGVGGRIGILTGGPTPPGTSVSGGAIFWKGGP
jgi:alpha-tubulin suppressor-like RCC1 family protein